MSFYPGALRLSHAPVAVTLDLHKSVRPSQEHHHSSHIEILIHMYSAALTMADAQHTQGC